LVAILGIAVVARSLDRERHGPEDQRPFDTDLVHQRATQKANFIMKLAYSEEYKMVDNTYRWQA
jgi:hypothetical protein